MPGVILGGYKRKRGRTPIVRILLRVRYEPAPIPGLDGDCWIWTGALTKGYGSIRVDGVRRYTHQVTYEHCIGPIPSGLEPDHLCKREACCNPWHLRYGTHAENMLARLDATLTHCGRNHERAVVGTHPSGGCAECAREDHRRWLRQRARAK